MSDKLEATEQAIVEDRARQICVLFDADPEEVLGAYAPVRCWASVAYHINEAITSLRTPTPEQAGELGDLPSRLIGWSGKARSQGRDRIELNLETVDRILAALRAPREVEKENADARREVLALITSIWRAEFRHEAPNWKPLPNLVGMITQLDNMYAGVRSQRDEARHALAALQSTPPAQPTADAVERAAKVMWEHADDEIGWEGSLKLAETDRSIQHQVEWIREEAALVVAALDQPTMAGDYVMVPREDLAEFIEAAGDLDEKHGDDSPIWESPAAMSISAGTLRRLAAAASPTGGE